MDCQDHGAEKLQHLADRWAKINVGLRWSLQTGAEIKYVHQILLASKNKRIIRSVLVLLSFTFILTIWVIALRTNRKLWAMGLTRWPSVAWRFSQNEGYCRYPNLDPLHGKSRINVAKPGFEYHENSWTYINHVDKGAEIQDQHWDSRWAKVSYLTLICPSPSSMSCPGGNSWKSSIVWQITWPCWSPLASDEIEEWWGMVTVDVDWTEAWNWLNKWSSCFYKIQW